MPRNKPSVREAAQGKATLLAIASSINRRFDPMLGKTHTEWAYFIRKGSNTVRAKGSDERELLGFANDIPFDDRVNHRSTLADLDLGLIRTFLRAIGSELYKTSAKMDFEALYTNDIFRRSQCLVFR